MRIAFVTPELQPLVRRTNLADMAGALPTTLVAQNHTVLVCLPHTVDVDPIDIDNLKEVGQVEVGDLSPIPFTVSTGIFRTIPIALFHHPELFKGRNPYGNENGPYPDNWRRYAAFARAVLASFALLKFHPTVIHCMDWTAGLVPLFRRTDYLQKDVKHPVSKAGIFFSFQNIAMQGSFERQILPEIGVHVDIFKNINGIERDGRVNFLKAGLEFAHVISAPSPLQAERIQGVERGYGLEGTFKRRANDLIGITNGINYHAWDPATDPSLSHPFSAKDKDLSAKRNCKRALQKDLGLDTGARTLLAGVIGRLDADGGYDLLAEVMTHILERNVELVLMGSGQPEILERIRSIEATFTGRCRLIENYDTRTAHRIMAGSDILLLPPHHNPTHALSAIAMRYGTPPLVYAHSGLEDTVSSYSTNKKTPTGFTFSPYSGEGLLEGLDSVRDVWKDTAEWKKLAFRCMRQDFSWEETAAQYVKAYRTIARRVKAEREALT